MNTMPQTFDARPLSRGAVPQPGPRAARGRPDAHLKLVLGSSEAAGAPAYGLNGRRHLASVPAREAQPQAPAGGADNADMAASWTPRRLEPLAFALVLLVSVAALAVALRAG